MTQETPYKVTARIVGKSEELFTRTILAVSRADAIERAWNSLFIGLPEDTEIVARAEPTREWPVEDQLFYWIFVAPPPMQENESVA